MNRYLTSVRALLHLAVVLTGFALGSAMFLSLHGLDVLIRAEDHEIDVTASIEDLAHDLQSASFQEASSLRGYLLTGDTKFMNRLNLGEANFGRAVAELKTLRIDPATRLRLKLITRLNADYLDIVKSASAGLKEGIPKVAIQSYVQRSSRVNDQIETVGPISS